MRFIILVLMIALAPLRGWAGEAMALEMATRQMHAMAGPSPAAAVAEAGRGAPDAAAHHGDCVGHAGVAADKADPPKIQEQFGGVDCPTCSVCQVCSSAAFLVQGPAAPVLQDSHGVPAFGGAAFTSAAPAPGLKPPIS